MRIPVPALVALFVISFLVDLYIWLDLKSYTSAGRRKPYTRIYAALSVVCWIFLIVMACIPLRDEASGIATVMWMLFSYMTVYVSKAVYCLFGKALLAVLSQEVQLWRDGRYSYGGDMLPHDVVGGGIHQT